jgi:hypothetical protein
MSEKDINGSLDFVYDFYRKMKNNKISLVYEGEISHEITKAFSSLAESHIAIDNESNSLQKRVFHVMVESLQNISKHSAERKDPTSIIDGHGLFLISKHENEYCITTGNVVMQEEVESIKENLEEINAGNKKTLKELYKQKIKKGSLSRKGGAGLGFIDMVRKTGEQLMYSFVELDDKKSYFILTSTISRIK